ncbi:MAG TPA: protein kinase, partial [Gemmataceae bacterium]|nr:protein kinase [Gemmataceae bacterium]
MTPCPPNDKWQAYADSRLGADEDGSFTAHVQDCPECEASLKALVAAPACGREKIRAKPALPPELVKGLCKLWDRTLEPEDLTSPGWWPKLDGYEILSVLGRGGMGVVYRAIEVDLGREVAVKMIAAGAGCSPSDIQRLLNEARTAAQLKHRHIVPVYSVSQHREQPCCVMEFLPAGSLAQRLNDLVNEPRETARLVAAVARAVAHAHA